MSYSVPSAFPSKIVAGTSLRFDPAPSDFAYSEGYQLDYHMVKTGQTPVHFSAYATGTNFGVHVPAATTSNWSPGQWNWSARASLSGETYPAGSGIVEVIVDSATATASTETRTHARKCLDLIEVALEGRIPSGMVSYQIEGRSITKIPLSELYELRKKYSQEVGIEQRKASGKPLFKEVGITFNRF